MGFLDRRMGKQMEKPAFAEAMAKLFAKNGVSVRSIDLNEFRLVLGESYYANLANVYSQYGAADAGDRDRVMQHFAASLGRTVSIPTRYGEAMKNLMPVVRPASFNSMMELQMRLGGKSDAAELTAMAGVQRALTDGLVVGLAFDTPHSFTHVNARQMTVWGVEFAQALSDAIANLRERTAESEIKQEVPGVFAGRWRDSYESSRVLLTDLVYRVGAGGDPVCFIPARDEFLVASRGDAQAVLLLLRMSEETHFGAYGLSAVPLVPAEGGWKAFEGDDSESRMQIRNLRLRRKGSEYAQQKQLLDAIHQRDGVDLFVATCMINEDVATGAIGTVCAWTQGVESSLPETETVALLIDLETKEHVIVPWEALLRVAADTVQEEPGLVPKRYRAEAFPSAEQIEELRRDA